MPKWKNKFYKLQGFEESKPLEEDNNQIQTTKSSLDPNFILTSFVDDTESPTLPATIPPSMEAVNVGYMVIGDKNNPSSLIQPANNNSVVDIPPTPTLDVDTDSTDPLGCRTTQNPLFQSPMHILDSNPLPPTHHRVLSSIETDESSLDQIAQNIEDLCLDIHPEIKDIPIDNPLYDGTWEEEKVYDNNRLGDLDNKSEYLSNKLTVVATVESDYLSQKYLLNSNLMDSEHVEPYIPEPDYAETEITMEFKNEDVHQPHPSRSPTMHLFKDYDGEDFGQYLSDDEDLSNTNGITWRKNIQYNLTKDEHNRKARTEIKRSRSGSRSSQRLFKSAPKIKGENAVRHNLRDFSFADAKMATTTSNDANKNRYKKKDEIAAEDEQFIRTKHSYEQFLHSRLPTDGDMGWNDKIWNEKEWNEKKVETKVNKVQPATDHTGKFTKKLKNGKDAIVGRLTTRFRRKSDSSYYLSGSIAS